MRPIRQFQTLHRCNHNACNLFRRKRTCKRRSTLERTQYGPRCHSLIFDHHHGANHSDLEWLSGKYRALPRWSAQHSTWTDNQTPSVTGSLAGPFHWAWWIAWAPFVGMFIAKISYGRTIRQFIIAVLMVPALLAWLPFSRAALFDLTREDSMLKEAVNTAMPTALFALLQSYPIGGILGHRCCLHRSVCHIFRFSVARHRQPCNRQQPSPSSLSEGRVGAWGAVAAALLYVGGLKALQTASLTRPCHFASLSY